MSTQPKRPGTEIEEDESKTLDARIATIDADEKESVDAKQAREEINRLRRLKHPVPR